jgi:hypothetical protein
MNPIEFIDKELEAKGFWNESKECWKEINEKDERFEDAIEEICERYEPEGGKRYDFDIDCEHVYESPGLDIFVVAVAYAYAYAFTIHDGAEPRANSVLYTAYLS